jgi:hypothetical protein
MAQNDKVPLPEDLRTEYEACQQAANNETMGYWTFAGIFLGLSSAVLAIIINVLLTDPGAKHLGLVVTFLALGMGIIYVALFQMLVRANNTQNKLFKRMKEIENATGMQMRKCQETVTGIRGQTLYGIILLSLGALWLVALVLALV